MKRIRRDIFCTQRLLMNT